MKIISDPLQETKMLFVDRSVKINLLCKFYETEKYLPELTLSHFIPRRTTMFFGISGYGSNNCLAISCGAKGLGEGASCGNVPVKNKDNRFLFLKENYIYISLSLYPIPRVRSSFTLKPEKSVIII